MAYTEERKNELLPIKTGGKTPWRLPDVQLTRDQVLSSNLLVKKKGVQLNLTQDHLIELIKCESDPIYFIENYCRVVHPDHGLVPLKLRDYQKEVINLYHNGRYAIVMQSRQSRKVFFR